MESGLRVNTPNIVGEVIDGEAVIMDLTRGHYFSTTGSGAAIWAGIAAGLGRGQIAAMLATRFRADHDVLARAVDSFVNELIEQGLVVGGSTTLAPDAASFGASASEPVPGTLEAFVAPVLNTYSDMEELLLLDPIHDVDATGWPTAKPADNSAP
jgi:hypothetical protein